VERVSAGSEHVSDLALDEWLASELDADASARVSTHVSGCARCAARKAQRDADREALLRQAPSFEALSAQVRARRAPPAGRTASRIAIGAGAGALALAASMLLLLRDPSVETTRSKGGAHLGLFVKRGERVTRGAPLEVVQPGDELRFTYTSARPVYLALINRDAVTASVYFPSGANDAARVGAGSDVALAFSVELDAQLGEERVYGVFCPEPFALGPLLAAVQRDGKPPALPDCELTAIRLIKERAR
jgi:hypothetical protein